MKSLPLCLVFLAAAQAQTNPAPLRALAAPASAAHSSSSGSASGELGAPSQPESIKFSDPAKPGTLKVRMARGSVRVRGGDAADVTVQTRLRSEQSEARDDGLRVLTSSSSYSLTEKDNVVMLDYGRNGASGPNADFTVTVPRHTTVIVSNLQGGEIACTDLEGNVEIRNINGRVRLDNVSGGALVETTNGEIDAGISRLHAGQPLSFTSVNGRVEIYLPDDAKANVQLRTRNGSVLTDFDDKALVVTKADLTRGTADPDAADRKAKHKDRNLDDFTSMDQERALRLNGGDGDSTSTMKLATTTQGVPSPSGLGVPFPALPMITGGKTVSGTLNGGGPEILAATMNGDVIVRKLSSRPSRPGE